MPMTQRTNETRQTYTLNMRFQKHVSHKEKMKTKINTRGGLRPRGHQLAKWHALYQRARALEQQLPDTASTNPALVVYASLLLLSLSSATKGKNQKATLEKSCHWCSQQGESNVTHYLPAVFFFFKLTGHTKYELRLKTNTYVRMIRSL